MFARYGELITDSRADEDESVVEVLTYEGVVVCWVADDTDIVTLLVYDRVLDNCSVDETATVEVDWVAAVVVELSM